MWTLIPIFCLLRFLAATTEDETVARIRADRTSILPKYSVLVCTTGRHCYAAGRVAMDGLLLSVGETT